MFLRVHTFVKKWQKFDLILKIIPLNKVEGGNYFESKDEKGAPWFTQTMAKKIKYQKKNLDSKQVNNVPHALKMSVFDIMISISKLLSCNNVVNRKPLQRYAVSVISTELFLKQEHKHSRIIWLFFEHRKPRIIQLLAF